MSDRTSETLVHDYLTLADDSCVAILPHALRVAAELRLADALADGPATLSELAAATNTHAPSLYRLLRALTSVDLLTQAADGRFSLTPTGSRLRSEDEHSVYASVVNRESQLAWLDAATAIRAGHSAFDALHGAGFFPHKDDDAQSNDAFIRRMRERANRTYGNLAEFVDWGGAEVVADLGGGDGLLLGRILDRAPHVTGLLVDRPSVVGLVARSGHLKRFGPRCRVIAEDFLRRVPANADTHLLCSVLHDWADDAVELILTNSRKALTAAGRLLVVEMLVPEDGTFHPSVWSDLGMLVLTGGKERTRAEYARLLAHAGYRLVSTRPIPASPFSLLEARP